MSRKKQSSKELITDISIQSRGPDNNGHNSRRLVELMRLPTTEIKFRLVIYLFMQYYNDTHEVILWPTAVTEKNLK